MARGAIIRVVRSLTGKESAHAQAAQHVHTTIGLAALSDIKADFIRKARGNVGEDGVKWPPLSRAYLAYGRRFGPGEKAQLKRDAGLGPGNRRRGLLNAAQDKRWRQIFGTRLARLAASMPFEAAKSRAAQIAWSTLKKEGAKTKLEVFGEREHEILRDTGVLLNSLSPGELDPGSGDYTPTTDQIFNLTGSGVIVGTNVKYASVHQNGSKSKSGRGGGIPARPFLPVGKAPSVWTKRWALEAQDAIHRVMLQELGGNA